MNACCPTCGIGRQYLEEAHAVSLGLIDGCPDAFHGDAATRALRQKRADERLVASRQPIPEQSP